MIPDLTVIRRQGRYSVLAHSQPVRLRDGTTIDLHLVEEPRPLEARFLRAVLDHELIQSHVFDVRDLAKCLDEELRTALVSDAGDLVVLTLRQFYPDGAALLTKIVEESLAKLPPPELPPQMHFAFDVEPIEPLTPAEADTLKRFVNSQAPAYRRPIYARGKEAGHV